METKTETEKQCDICGDVLSSVRGWQKLPACPSALFCGGMCCYNITCCGNCHFRCVDCGDIVYESRAKLPPNAPANAKKGVYKIHKTEHIFQCYECHQKKPQPTFALYPFWGDVREYVRRYEGPMDDDEFNEILSECTYKNPDVLESDEAIYQSLHGNH